MTNEEMKVEAEQILSRFTTVQVGTWGAHVVDEIVALCERVREGDAVICDTRRAVFGPQSLMVDQYQRGLIDALEGCAKAIRAGG